MIDMVTFTDMGRSLGVRLFNFRYEECPLCGDTYRRTDDTLSIIYWKREKPIPKPEPSIPTVGKNGQLIYTVKVYPVSSSLQVCKKCEGDHDRLTLLNLLRGHLLKQGKKPEKFKYLDSQIKELSQQTPSITHI